jgi:hypothetical protein
VKRTETGPVHISAVVIPIFLSVAGSAGAQTPEAPTWSLAPALSLVTFSPIGAEGSGGAEALFGGATSAGLSVRRSAGPVALALSLEFLSTLLQVRDEAVMVEAQAPAVVRSRLGVAAGRQVARLGTGRLTVEGGPTLDVWSSDRSESRSRVGGTLRLVLGVDAGPFALEQSIGAGISASPLEAHELPEGYGRRAMRTIVVSLAARFGL